MGSVPSYICYGRDGFLFVVQRIAARRSHFFGFPLVLNFMLRDLCISRLVPTVVYTFPCWHALYLYLFRHFSVIMVHFMCLMLPALGALANFGASFCGFLPYLRATPFDGGDKFFEYGVHFFSHYVDEFKLNCYSLTLVISLIILSPLRNVGDDSRTVLYTMRQYRLLTVGSFTRCFLACIMNCSFAAHLFVPNF